MTDPNPVPVPGVAAVREKLDRLATRFAERAIAEHDGDEAYFRVNAPSTWSPINPEMEFGLAVGDPDLSGVLGALAIAETRPELVHFPVIREQLRNFIVRWTECTPADVRAETFRTAARDYRQPPAE